MGLEVFTIFFNLVPQSHSYECLYMWYQKTENATENTVFTYSHQYQSL